MASFQVESTQLFSFLPKALTYYLITLIIISIYRNVYYLKSFLILLLSVYRYCLSQRMTKPTIKLVGLLKTQISLQTMESDQSSLTVCSFYSLRAIQRGMNNP